MNTILENRLEQVDGAGWYTGLISEIVLFHSYPNVAIQKESDVFNRVNTIEKPVINTKGWGVQVLWEDQLTDRVPLSLIK